MSRRTGRHRDPASRRPSAEVARFEERLSPRLEAWRRNKGLPDDYRLSREEWDELVGTTVMEMYGDWTATARRTVAKLEKHLAQAGITPAREG